MRKTGIPALILILALILASGCVSRSINPLSMQKEQGHAEIRYSLEQESGEYNFTTGLWKVTFNMTVTITNTDTEDSAEIRTVDITIWPSFKKGQQSFGTIFETIGFYKTIEPGQSVTKRTTFAHTFTDAELSAFQDPDRQTIITVPGYTITDKTPIESTGAVNPAAGIQKTPVILTPSPAPSPSGRNTPATTTPRAGAMLRASPNSPGGILVYYDFEDDFPSVGRVADRSGNGHNAMLKGNLRIVPGIGGKQAIQFDGKSYILTDTNPAAGRKEVTWAFWFKTDNPDNNYKMASAAWWHGGPGSGWTMATHIPEFWAEDTKGVCLSNITNADNRFLRGEWNYEVVTYDGRIIREYTNGKLINTWQTRGVPLGTGSPMAIGGWPDVGFLYTGSIDDFVVYDHPLTAQEISRLYAA